MITDTTNTNNTSDNNKYNDTKVGGYYIRHRLNGYLAQRYLVFFPQAVSGCV